MHICVTRIHTEQVRSEDRGFVATCARADFHDDVPLIARVFRNEHAFDLFFKDFDLRLKLSDVRFSQCGQFRIFLGRGNCSGFLKAFHGLTVFACLLDDQFEIDAFLIDLRSALIVIAHFEQCISKLFVAFLDAF